MTDSPMSGQVNDKIFSLDKKFWNNYLKGRPQAPDAFFDRIFNYHQSQGGTFGTVHDVGAGNAPYADRLKARFAHVIVSDIAASNVKLAEERLGKDGFSYRAARVEEADDIPAGSVDFVFATNVMHFPDQKVAMSAIARQLKSGGTFSAALFGPARFEDPELQSLWEEINFQGGRQLLQKADRPEQTIAIMTRTQDKYNVAPLDPELFRPGAQRVNLNMSKGGIVGMLPPEEIYRDREPRHSGPDDIESFEDEAGWSFEADLAGVKEHIGSFPFLAGDQQPFAQLFDKLESFFKGGKTVRGYFPAKVILATRR